MFAYNISLELICRESVKYLSVVRNKNLDLCVFIDRKTCNYDGNQYNDTTNYQKTSIFLPIFIEERRLLGGVMNAELMHPLPMFL